MSIKTLKIAGLNMSNVTFRAITNNSGDDGAVQHRYPPFKANKIMSKESKKPNFQCHTPSKAIKNSCIKTFSKQGIGRNNLFQAEYDKNDEDTAERRWCGGC
jgi:hypothetical protein